MPKCIFLSEGENPIMHFNMPLYNHTINIFVQKRKKYKGKKDTHIFFFLGNTRTIIKKKKNGSDIKKGIHLKMYFCSGYYVPYHITVKSTENIHTLLILPPP